MGKLIATIKFTQEYGHPGNRPSEDFARRELTKALEKAIDDAGNRSMKSPFSKGNELSSWSFVGIEVE